MDFTRIAKERMNELKIRPINLARKAGYSPQYISDLLSGKKRWNETTITKVCQVLGLKIHFSADGAQATTLDATGTE